MTFADSRQHGSSIRLRLLFSTTLLLLLGLISLSWVIGRQMREEMKEMLGSQQLATTSAIASMIDHEVQDRLTALEKVSERFSTLNLDDRPHVQQELSELVVLQHLFTAGVFLTDAQGTAIASMPMQTPRVGLYFGDRDYVQKALLEGTPQVGKPVVGRVLGEKVLGLAVPILDRKQRVLGVVAGITNLEQPNFFDQIRAKELANKATVLIVSRAHRQIIMSSDRSRVMETLPPEGINASLDDFIGGAEGNREFTNHLDMQVLASVRQIPSAGWYAAIATPSEIIYSPVRDMEIRIGLSVLGMAALLGLALWWLLRRELDPLQQTAQALARQTLPGAKLEPLPVRRDDEIGLVLQGFNHLMRELQSQQMRLADSEKTYRTAFSVSPDALSISRIEDGILLEINEGYTRLLGYTSEECLGRSSLDLQLWAQPQDREKVIQAVRDQGHARSIETELRHKSGRIIPVEISAGRLQVRGHDAMMTVCHDLSIRKATQQTIRNLAEYDTLTGLPNRNLFMRQLSDAVAQSIASRQLGALLCIDLDDFKTLNDSQGHDLGDQFLRAIGQRLRESQTGTAFAGRLGGDEFVVMLRLLGSDEASARAMAIEKAREIQDLLAEPIQVQGSEYHRSASIGLSLFGLREESAREAVKRSDLAMHQAKVAGRKTVMAFESWMQATLSLRSDMESRLRAAIVRQDLVVHFQPQSRGLEVFGAEALLRWNDPQQGWIPPSEFIPLAEESGLIVEIGQWVLQTVCERLRLWQQDPALQHMTLSVNISAQQFMREDFVPMVLRVLTETGAPGHRLKLEITESLLIQDIEGISRKMLELKAMGIGFSLDDFGTGYSSLAYLKRLPLNELKIDQGFVRDIMTDNNDAAIAQMVIALGNTLGLKVVAEGVETEAQRLALERMGCQCFQGYLFGRAMPVQDLEDQMRHGKSAA